MWTPVRPLGSRRREQLRQPDEVIGGGCKGEGEAHPVAAPKPRLLLPRDRLDPAEALLDLLADAQAEPVACVPRRTPVDGRRSAAQVLRHMRRHPHRSQLVDEVLRVISLVGRERDPPRAVGARRDHIQSGDAFGMDVRGSQAGVDEQRVAVLHQRMADETQLGLLARALAVKPRLQVAR